MKYIPQQGDIVIITFDPRKANEQQGRRPGVVISNIDYHQKTNGLSLICPITSTISDFPMHVKLDERTSTKGEIMCEQIVSLNLAARNVDFLEFVPDDILDEAIDIVCSMIE